MDYKIDNLNSFKDFVKHKISTIRLARGYTSRGLSLELNKSSEYLNQLENGRLNPSLEFLYEFCAFFDITLASFFDTDNAHPVEFNDICKNLSSLLPEEVNQIAAIVKTIAQGKR